MHLQSRSGPYILKLSSFGATIALSLHCMKDWTSVDPGATGSARRRLEKRKPPTPAVIILRDTNQLLCRHAVLACM